MAKIIELIYAEKEKGNGTPDNITRIVKQFWTKEGVLILEIDPCGENRVDANFPNF